MLHLITGTPGSGKTLFAVSKIMQYVKENEQLLKDGKEPRAIYADIDGLEIEGVEPSPEDWRETPDGSVIFYDEIQQRKAYKKDKNDNDIVNALQIHRHTGHDIYGITQFPVLLHQNFKAVVGLHYHLHRGWGLQAATVYQYAYCVDAPNAPSNKRLAEHTFRFNYPKGLFNYYKSATQHTHTARIPKKMFLLIGFVLFMGYVAYHLMFGKDNFITSVATGKLDKSATAVTASAPAITATPISAPAQTVQQIDQQRQIIEEKYLTLYDMEVAENDNIRPAVILRANGRCRAFNQFGDNLDVSQDLCNLMLKDGSLIPHKRQAQAVNTNYQLPVQKDKPIVKTVSAPPTVFPSSAPAVISMSAVAPVMQHSITKM